jgi:hypothetical protein
MWSLSGHKKILTKQSKLRFTKLLVDGGTRVAECPAPLMLEQNMGVIMKQLTCAQIIVLGGIICRGVWGADQNRWVWPGMQREEEEAERMCIALPPVVTLPSKSQAHSNTKHQRIERMGLSCRCTACAILRSMKQHPHEFVKSSKARYCRR